MMKIKRVMKRKATIFPKIAGGKPIELPAGKIVVLSVDSGQEEVMLEGVVLTKNQYDAIIHHSFAYVEEDD